MALIDVLVPDIGDFSEVTVIEVLVKPGDTIKAEQSLITVESDKASMEIPCSHAGTVQALKLNIGDTYLGEGSSEALVLAINEFQEFLSFYPTHPRADYAQYKLSMAHFRQMRSPQRDQSETREAIRDFETFVLKYPNSALMPEVTARLRDAKDRLGDSDYLVGVFYFKQQWFPGTIDRLAILLKNDPEFSRRDAAYYYLGESLLKVKRPAEALPYFERLVKEFEKSEYLDEAKRRRRA